MEKIEEHSIFLDSISRREDSLLEFVFYSKEVEKISVSLLPVYKSLFSFWAEYIGVYGVSGIPDFVGDKDEMENVCTVSYSLEKILESKGRKVIWEKYHLPRSKLNNI